MSKFSYRIYYEDTDAGGVVYYANYLKFAERARTDLLREQGIDQSLFAKEQGILFVVKEAALDIKKSLKLDDIVDIETKISAIGGASIDMQQLLYCNDNLMASLDVKIVAVSKAFKPVRLSADLKRIFEMV